MYDFFSLFLGVQSAPEVGPTSYETPCINVQRMTNETIHSLVMRATTERVKNPPPSSQNFERNVETRQVTKKCERSMPRDSMAR